MKKFLLISFGLLVVAVIVVVAVFYYISFQIDAGQSAVGEDASVTEQGTATVPVPDAVPLRDLPINDTQQEVLETVGVDVDTFVITPAMQICAAEKLGAERMAEIVAGGAPTTLETAKLLPCLGVQ